MLPDKTMNAQRLAEAREEWLDGRRRGPFLSALYDVVVLTRLPQTGAASGLCQTDRGPPQS